MKAWVALLVDGLEPRAIVNVGHRGNLGADHVDPAPQVRIVLHGPHRLGIDGDPAVLEHRGHQEHVGALLARFQVEPFDSPFPQDRRRKWAKALAELDLEVHGGLHGRRAGIAQNAARTQGPGPELHPALEPADDLAIGQQSGDMFKQVVLFGEMLPGCPLLG